MNNGFYIASIKESDFGLAVHMTYSPDTNDIWLAVKFGFYLFGIGYKF